jgi:HEAT repeat protein
LAIKDVDAFLRNAEKAITQSPDVVDRVNAIHGLATIDRPELREKICQLAIRARLDPDPSRRAERAARQLLGRHSLTAVPLLFQQGREDPYILLTACELAGECSLFGQEFVPALTEIALHHEDPTLRAAALRALEDIGPLDEAGRAVLTTAIKDSDPAVRMAAARALIVQGRISKTDPIIDALIKNAPPVDASMAQAFQQQLSHGVD